jgi:hypothetical protein
MTPLMKGADVLIISITSSISRKSSPLWIASFWQYEHRSGHPRKKTVQTDLPLQSTVESGTNPPKFSLIEITVQEYFCTGII